MKILSNTIDGKSYNGSMKLIPQNKDDLYYLGIILKVGDKISSYTTRKISPDGGKTQKKITLKLAIILESFDADLETGIIYVKGKTCIENEHVRIGSYHTLDIILGEEFTLHKNKWLNMEISKIKNAAKDNPEICIVVFYDKDCVVSTVSSNEVKIVFKTEIKNKKFADLISNLTKIKERIKNFLILGFSDIIQEFNRILIKEDNSISSRSSICKLTADYKGLSNSKVVSKIMSDYNIMKSINNIKFVDDIIEIQRLFSKMDMMRENVCIGIKEVAEAIDYGAVNILFVTDKFCRPKSINERIFTDGIINTCKDMRAKICEIPIALEVGERLDTLGGIICTLKFEYK